MSDVKKLLDLRRKQRNRKPSFRRQGYGIYKRIGDEWRKPRGRHSKQRHQMAGKGKIVKPGFRTNKLVRGLDHSGLMPVVINSISHVSLLNKSTHGAIVGGNVGNRKRLLLISELKKHGIKVLNLKEGHDKKIEEEFKKRKQMKTASSKKSESPKKDKKEAKEMTPEEKEAAEKQEKDRVLHKEQK